MSMLKHKKILIFIDWFLPGFLGGGPIVSIYNFINLFYKDYEIFLFTRANDFKTHQNYEGITINEWINFENKTHIYYCNQKDLSFFKIKEVIKKVNPDIIYINSMFSYYFSIVPNIIYHIFYKKNIKLILAPRGMLLTRATNDNFNFLFKDVKKNIFFFIFKLLSLQKNTIFQVTSTQEYSAVINRFNVQKKNIVLIPNIVSTNLLSQYKIASKSVNELKLFYASRIAKEKNVLHSIEMLRLVKFPVHLHIFGEIEQSEYWKICQDAIHTLPIHIKVTYHGVYNTTEIRKRFADYHALIFPTFGESYGHVIIEALLLGKPVITTPYVPWLDIESKNAGWIIDLFDKKRYQEVFQLLFEMSQEEYEINSKAALDYAKSHIDSTNYRQEYLNLFDKI